MAGIKVPQKRIHVTMCLFSRAKNSLDAIRSGSKGRFEPFPVYRMTQSTPELHSIAESIPQGFEHLDRGSPFVGLLGPIFHKTLEGRHVIGIRIEHKHTNVKGIAHGGMLVTLADTALGIALSLETNGTRPMVTANLSTDFLDAAHPGDWVEAHVDIQRIGARLAFASCHLMVDGKRILRASGVFAGIATA